MSEIPGLGQEPEGFRSGFACLVGRPNVGKSTLLNQVLRSKVVITSPRPQTTRNAIRGVLTTPKAQLVFVDTPGLHKPRTALGTKLNEVVRRALSEVDIVLFLVDAAAGIGKGDAYLAEELAGVRDTPVVVVLNKVDRVSKPRLLPMIEQLSAMGEWAAIVPVSARTGENVTRLVSVVESLLPEGPVFYPPEMLTDQPEQMQVAELIREKVLHLTREEVPHSVAVVVDAMAEREDGLLEIEASIYVERTSQKGIVIGKGGEMLKTIGTRARQDIEILLGRRCFLHLRVRVERDWQRRVGLIARFGYGR